MRLSSLVLLGTLATLSTACSVAGHGYHVHENKEGEIHDEADATMADFDIVHARVTRDSNALVFHMHVSGKAGETRPTARGTLASAEVFSYVWPTSLDSSVVGFEPDQGILAFAVTAHPDFDDTPLYDEDGNGSKDDDGYLWHSHWVVLAPDDACGPGALKVKDIPEGESPRVPLTWPGLPILIDSPDIPVSMDAAAVAVRVPFADASELKDVRFDAVTAGLQVNANVHAPLLCVRNVFDIASDDLSLPGRVQ
jgi:hypothetical protein